MSRELRLKLNRLNVYTLFMYYQLVLQQIRQTLKPRLNTEWHGADLRAGLGMSHRRVVLPCADKHAASLFV